MVRGIAARARFKDRRRVVAAELIQSHVRMCRARSELRRSKAAALAFQCAWRCKMARRELRRRRAETKEAGALMKAKSQLEKR